MRAKILAIMVLLAMTGCSRNKTHYADSGRDVPGTVALPVPSADEQPTTRRPSPPVSGVDQ